MMDTDSFIVNIKTEDVYQDTAVDIEKKLIFQTIKKNKRPFLTCKNDKSKLNGPLLSFNSLFGHA